MCASRQGTHTMGAHTETRPHWRAKPGGPRAGGAGLCEDPHTLGLCCFFFDQCFPGPHDVLHPPGVPEPSQDSPGDSALCSYQVRGHGPSSRLGSLVSV